MLLRCVLILIKYFIVHARYNVTEKEAFKIKFGCIPQETWDLLEYRKNIVKNVCVTRDYETHVSPPKGIQSLDHYNPIVCQLRDTRLRNVDQTKKTITINFVARFTWEDPRIKADFGKNSDGVDLPPITTEGPDLIWTPYASMHVKSLTTRRYILDPVITTRIKVHTGSTENKLTRLNVFSPNSTIVKTKLEWMLTVTCHFNFSTFPFDTNICPVEISFYKMNVTLQVRPTKSHRIQKEAEGFDLNQYAVSYDEQEHYRNSTWHKFTFGIHIYMKRQFTKYLFQYYLPCITIVIASSISFIIPMSAIPGRIALVVTLFLTLTNIFIHQMVYQKLIIINNFLFKTFALNQ